MAYLDIKATQECMQRVAQIMKHECEWDDKRLEKELQLAQDYLKQMGK